MSGIMIMFAGGAKGPISDFGGSMNATRVPSSTAATATVTFNTDGTVSGTIGGTGSNGATGDRWYQPTESGIGSGYWIRATLSSGLSPNNGNPGVGTWLALSSGRTWGYTSGGGTLGTRDGTLLFEIASDSGGSTVVCSGSFSFSVYNEA